METSLYFIKMKAVIKHISELGRGGVGGVWGGERKRLFSMAYLFFKIFTYLEPFLKLKYSNEPDPSAFEAKIALKANWHFA